MINWKSAILKPNDKLKKAIEVLGKGGLRIVMIADTNNKLLGTITDGDVRRALINQNDLNITLDRVMFDKPSSVLVSETKEKILSIMKVKDIMQIPLVNHNKEIVGLEILQHLMQNKKIENPVFLMAGGFGKRLMPLTKNTPKPLLKIGNIPILEKTIIQLSESGFYNFIISTHYKSEMFKDYFGNGKNWKVNIEYIYENKPLGTAGSISLLKNIPKLPVLIMNSDLLTKINFESLINYHNDQMCAATVCVRDHEVKIPYGIVETKDGLIRKIEEKPKKKFFINAGIYVIEPELIKNIATNKHLNMTDFLQNQVDNDKKIGIFPIHEYWLDIGHRESFEQAKKDEAEFK